MGPVNFTRNNVRAGPEIAPIVPPAAIYPYNLLAWLLEKISAIKLQKTDIINKLYTLAHI